MWDLSRIVRGCGPGPELRGAALYLGLYRPARCVEALRGRYDLKAIEEREARVAPAMQFVNTQCKVGDPHSAAALPGSSLADCTVRLGWYELAPRDTPDERGPAR